MTDVPDDMKDIVEKYRTELVEAAADLMMHFLKNSLVVKNLVKRKLWKVSRAATIAYKIVPIYAGTSLRNKGVQPVLDGIIDYLPSPKDLSEFEGTNPKTGEKTRKLSKDEPLTALAFKINWIHMWVNLPMLMSILEPWSQVHMHTTSRKMFVKESWKTYDYACKSKKEIDIAYAEKLLDSLDLKDTGTGEQLNWWSAPTVLEQISFPEPVISLAIEQDKIRSEKTIVCFAKIVWRRSNLPGKMDHDTNQTIISGMGELHLEILVDRMKREMNMDVNVGKTRWPTETIQKACWGAEGKYIRQSGGRGQYGHCFLKLEPLGRGERIWVCQCC